MLLQHSLLSSLLLQPDKAQRENNLWKLKLCKAIWMEESAALCSQAVVRHTVKQVPYNLSE